MKKKRVPDQLRLLGTEYEGLSQELFRAAQLIDQNERYNLKQKMMSLDRVAETATVKLRDVAARMSEMDVSSFYDEVVHLLNISVEEHDKWLEIRVPAVLPNRRARDNQAFLVRPLRHALIEFQKRTPIERFGECAICIVHSYDESLGMRRIRDYDNIETKRYLDVIEAVFLTNDSGLLCSVLQTTEIAHHDETTFYIMQPETLAVWAKENVKTHTPKCSESPQKSGIVF